jgi:hypothetical protein
VVSDASGAGLAAAACEAVAQSPSVIAAGAVGSTREARVLGLEAGLAQTTISAQAARIAWPEDGLGTTPGRLTPGFQALTKLGPGVLYQDVGGKAVALPVRAVTGAGRYPPLDGGVLVVSETLAEVSYCLAEAPPEMVEAAALEIAATAFSHGVIAVPVVGSEEAKPTPDDLARDHKERLWPIVAAAFLAIAAAVRLLLSRRDRAVYRLYGLGRWDLALMGTLDYLVCLAAPCASTVATVVLLGEASGVSTPELGLLDLGLLTAASAGLCVLCAALWAVGRNRHQFAAGT